MTTFTDLIINIAVVVVIVDTTGCCFCCCCYVLKITILHLFLLKNKNNNFLCDY